MTRLSRERPPTSLLILLFVALFINQAVLALYEDQAGLNDWLIENIGRLSAKSPRAVVLTNVVILGTEAGVVAALEPATGKLLWRRVATESEGPVRALCVEKGVVVSATAARARAWRAADGELLWESQPWATAATDGTASCALSGSGLVVKDPSGSIHQLDASTGKHVRTLPGSFEALCVEAGSRRVFAQAASPAGSVVEISAAGQAPSSTVSSGALALFAGCSALIEKEGAFSVLNLVTGQSKAVPTEGLDKPITLLSENLRGDEDAFTLATPKQKRGFFIRSTGNVEKIQVEGERWISATPSFVVSLRSGQVINTGTSKAFNVFSTKPAEQAPAVWAHVSNTEFLGALVARSDGSLAAYVLDGSVKWTREEGLSEITQMISTVLPLTTGASSIRQAPTALERYRRQFAHIGHRFVGFLQWTQRFLVDFAPSSEGIETAVRNLQLMAQGKSAQIKSKAVATRNTDEERERFGFSRVIVALSATPTPKLFGLNSESGQVLWSKPLLDVTAPRLLPSRDQPSATAPPEIVVIEPSSGAAHWISSLDGKTLESFKPKTKARVVQTVPIHDGAATDPHERRAYALLLAGAEASSELTSLVIPPTSPHKPRHTFGYVVRNETLQGFPIVQGKPLAPSWSVAIPKGSKLSALAVSPADADPVASPARAMGDGQVLVKHINPNLIALVLTSSTGLRVLLIDAVSGRVAHRISHKDGAEPVHAVRYENILVYSYWNKIANRAEIGSLHLYERVLDKRALTPWAKRPAGLETPDVSSFETAASAGGHLMVNHRVFTIPGQSVGALGVTTTKRGISTKTVMIALGGTGQVVLMNHQYLDPRRTSGPPTDVEKLEGLFEYKPELPLIPTHYLSYYKGALRPKLFHVAPAKIESTCTVLVAGLDVFKGRAAPSGTFDLLAEDFNYALLGLLCTGMSVGVFVLRKLERVKSLKDAWI